MFRSRSRGFYLYMFLRSCTERDIERERESSITSLSDTYTVSSNTALSVRYCATRKGIQQFLSLCFATIVTCWIEYLMDASEQGNRIVSFPLSLSFEGLTNEDRIESLVCKFSRRVKLVKFAWRPTHGETILTICPPFVLFFHSCTVLRSII